MFAATLYFAESPGQFLSASGCWISIRAAYGFLAGTSRLRTGKSRQLNSARLLSTMDTAEKMTRARERYGLLFTALAPVVLQVLGSAFNIWYNAAVIEPMLTSPALKQRFFVTIIIYNALVCPIGIWLWMKRIRYFAPAFRHLCRGSIVDPMSLTRSRRRPILLPWFAAAICGGAWFLCVPV